MEEPLTTKQKQKYKENRGNNKHAFYLPYNHGILVGSFPTLLRVDTSDVTCTIATYSARKRSQECIILGF
jgi:hypothetical protein